MNLLDLLKCKHRQTRLCKIYDQHGSISNISCKSFCTNEKNFMECKKNLYISLLTPILIENPLVCLDCDEREE